MISQRFGCYFLKPTYRCCPHVSGAALCNGRVSVRLSVPSIDICRRLGACSRYRSTAAGVRATAAGSVMLRAEVRRLNTVLHIRQMTLTVCELFSAMAFSSRRRSKLDWRIIVFRFNNSVSLYHAFSRQSYTAGRKLVLSGRIASMQCLNAPYSCPSVLWSRNTNTRCTRETKLPLWSLKLAYKWFITSGL